ncbi:NPC intracellular cholesterol transporter 2-like [Topomyia yanbarensis]|uniref:NPC intracellular cholesterol transporter 2-like n=1 Tax=Topomyia yanbarensis TaxID=2498891 RepID=UPI00273C48AD|nr:NPC intracellular cholesterol transporter 2-like [Topomyia yanbarensis]
MFSFFLLATALPAIAFGLAVRPCPSNAPTPVEVRVVDCYVEPCVIPLGGMVDMDLDFISDRSSATVIASLDIYLGNFRVPYELPKDQQDACNFFYGRGCPILLGEKINYHLSTPASAPFANVTVDLELQLTGDDGEPLFCFRSSARIIPANQRLSN